MEQMYYLDCHLSVILKNMKVILMSYMYIEFDNAVYFLKDYVRTTFFEYKDIGGNRIERYVLKEIYCNSNSAYTYL